MDRKETAERIKIMQAFVDGKQIEFKDSVGRWCEAKNPLWNWDSGRKYRIKPEPKYHPFLNAEECWQEMKKHEPFGWVKDKQDGHYALITAVEDGARATGLNGVIGWNFTTLKKYFDFADGTPFGIKVE